MEGMGSYRRKSPWVQRLCPAPKRYFQELIAKHGLRSGLDIGCGLGSPLSHLRSPTFRSVGIDIHQGSVDISREHNVHDEYVVGDFLSYDFDRRFDVVMLSHTIEHFPRDAGMEALRRVESLAERLIYIETPNGFLEQKAEADNPWQRHLSGWFPHDFEVRGYTVFGGGRRSLRGPNGRAIVFPEQVTHTIERLLQWFTFRHPAGAHAIAAIRYTDENGDIRQL